MKRNSIKAQLPLLVILAGIIYSLWLQSLVPEGVFFSGDAGLKALLAQQWSSGIFRFDLVKPNIDWVHQLWQDGLYPYEPPFVYYINQRYYITFPFTFPLVTAPFAALFGFRGLYIIPIVAIWIFWLVFYQVCRQLKFTPFYTAIALIAVIFASPLTVYSAMYWEHTLAVALAWCGMCLLLSAFNSSLSVSKAVWAGILIGLSVWFRPEFLCLVAILIPLGYVVTDADFYRVSKFISSREIFIISIIFTVLFFFGLNWLIYGHPLGIHAIQIVQEETTSSQKISDIWTNFSQLGRALFKYYPIIWILIIAMISAIYAIKIDFIRNVWLNYLSIFLYVVGVAIIVPIGTAGSIPGGKQWGARFLLITIPIITLVAVYNLLRLNKNKKTYLIAAVFFGFLLIIGIELNTFQAIEYLQRNYKGVLEAVNYLNNQAEQIVAVSHQYAGQAIEPSVENKILFKVNNQEQLTYLSKSLIGQQQTDFIYVCYPHQFCPVPEITPIQIVENNQKYQVELTEQGIFGKYPIYEANINKL